MPALLSFGRCIMLEYRDSIAQVKQRLTAAAELQTPRDHSSANFGTGCSPRAMAFSLAMRSAALGELGVGLLELRAQLQGIGAVFIEQALRLAHRFEHFGAPLACFSFSCAE
jgi:hypothetical protein